MVLSVESLRLAAISGEMTMKIRNLLVVLAIISEPTWGTLILDQSYVPSTTQGSVISEPESIQAQTFTVGVGGQLAQVDLFVHIFASSGADDLPDENLEFMVLGTDSEGVPQITETLATVSMPASKLPTNFFDFISIDLAPFDIILAVDDILALALRTDYIPEPGMISPGYSWLISGGDPYPGGNMFFSSNFGKTFDPTGQPTGSSDLGFRTFMIDEPSTISLIALSVPFLMATRRVRCRKWGGIPHTSA